MNFNRHLECDGRHATFSPSNPAWFRYTKGKISKVLDSKEAARHGTRLHAWAAEAIDLRIKQRRSKDTLCNYINDGIGFGMHTEVHLKYSNEVFGTADAICFDENTRLLRIHDLKTGTTPASMDQLVGYAALFCLEYGYSPESISIELRIYQNNDVIIYNPAAEYVRYVMDHIILCDDVYEAKARGELITYDEGEEVDIQV